MCNAIVQNTVYIWTMRISSRWNDLPPVQFQLVRIGIMLTLTRPPADIAGNMHGCYFGAYLAPCNPLFNVLLFLPQLFLSRITGCVSMHGSTMVVRVLSHVTLCLTTTGTSSEWLPWPCVASMYEKSITMFKIKLVISSDML